MSGGRILVVDDEASLREAFVTFLQEAGYEAVAAADGAGALDRLSENVALAFVDIRLARESGITLCARLRERSPAIEIVLITGVPTIDNAAAAVRLGVFDYLVKPVRRDALLRITDLALRHQRLRAAREGDRLHLEAVFRSVRDAMFTVDGAMRTRQLNDAAERLCAVRRDRLLGVPLDASALSCSADCLKALRETVTRGVAVEAGPIACDASHRAGQIVSVAAAPLVGADGRTSGAVLAIRDETRLVELEQSLRQQDTGELIGRCQQIQRVRACIESLADLPTTVLITGESGTGKEIVADALHHAGRRRSRLLVKVNCGALPEELLDSELFGHVRGAFTGALRDRVGRFESADGGSILLDEIGELSPRMQLRFLRVLETMEFQRIGASKPIHVDVRVIAATNRDLAGLVARGAFREDLYFRLKVFEIHLPALREHMEDLPGLVAHLLGRLRARIGKPVTAVSDGVMELLLCHRWPGNVRELEHVLEHGAVLATGSIIRAQDLPRDFPGVAVTTEVAGQARGGGKLARIDSALRQAGQNKSQAARLLGMSRRTLYRHLERRSDGQPGDDGRDGAAGERLD